jgi:hypothetical protein
MYQEQRRSKYPLSTGHITMSTWNKTCVKTFTARFTLTLIGLCPVCKNFFLKLSDDLELCMTSDIGKQKTSCFGDKEFV